MNNSLPETISETSVSESPEVATAPLRDLPAASAAHPEVELLLRLLDESTTHWRNEMLYVMSDQFPEGWGRVEPTVEEIVWQPFPGSHSIGAGSRSSGCMRARQDERGQTRKSRSFSRPRQCRRPSMPCSGRRRPHSRFRGTSIN